MLPGLIRLTIIFCIRIEIIRKHSVLWTIWLTISMFLMVGAFLDLACGKGRHSIYLNQLGYKVTGIDLSEQSIAHAKQFENNTLSFEVHDMTQAYPETFDAVFNLFTSFGYFEDERSNLEQLSSLLNRN
jgi:SAM-dependent methyltransferase